jgi:hypothetical protein
MLIRISAAKRLRETAERAAEQAGRDEVDIDLLPRTAGAKSLEPA